jgi:hypothetical protein
MVRKRHRAPGRRGKRTVMKRTLLQLAAGGSLALFAASSGWGAEPPADSATAKARSTPAPATARPAAARPVVGKGPIPDPTLLDGSTHPVEKKSEYGMIGEFELPGNENANGGKVGGPQVEMSVSGINTGLMGLPQIAGGGGGAPSVGLPSLGLPDPSAASSGPPPGGLGQLPSINTSLPNGQPAGQGQPGPQNPSAAGNPVGAAGSPGMEVEGVQVAQMGGPPSGAAGGAVTGKPQAIAIGDRGMQIQQPALPPGVVGVQPKVLADGHIQQHEKQTGTGGKPPTAPQGPGRIEKGQAIPAGL